jgi:hypothetical protein
MRETFKDVEIKVGEGKHRKFRLNKFDAQTGSYIIYTLLTQVLPMGLGNQIEGLSTEGNLPVMSKEKFFEIQKDCLLHCAEIQTVGNVVSPMPVMMKDGRWGVPDLEFNAPLIMALTIQVLGYNAQSFFDENTLEMFKEGISQLTLSNV